jgi:hypothetical protein
MAQSTSTLLDVVNKVLANNGEREQRQLNTPTSYLARECVSDALTELLSADDWEWARVFVDGGSANFPSPLTPPLFLVGTEYTRFHGLSRFDTACKAYVPLVFLDPLEFDTHPQIQGTVPTAYTIRDDARVYLNCDTVIPATDYALYRAYISRKIPMPTLDTLNFDMNEQAIPLLVSLASSKFAHRHTGETTSANRFQGEYEQHAQQQRNTKRLRPSTAFNMYRGRRNG